MRHRVEWNKGRICLYSSMKQDWEADWHLLADFFRNAQDLSAIILDMRRNSGGSGLYWRKNIVELLGAPAPFKAFMAIRRRLVTAGRRPARQDSAHPRELHDKALRLYSRE
ncbi:MAG TPA: hypothetical protein GX716_00090 [Firmicutes bacterium]|nr:hypothetical protein [Candidatus Fermentithermobacillaceae bacterium]